MARNPPHTPARESISVETRGDKVREEYVFMIAMPFVLGRWKFYGRGMIEGGCCLGNEHAFLLIRRND